MGISAVYPAADSTLCSGISCDFAFLSPIAEAAAEGSGQKKILAVAVTIPFLILLFWVLWGLCTADCDQLEKLPRLWGDMEGQMEQFFHQCCCRIDGLMGWDGQEVEEMLPFIGTGIVLVPLAVWQFVNLQYGKMVVCLLLYGACAPLREWLEPKLIGRRVGIAPVCLLLGIYA